MRRIVLSVMLMSAIFGSACMLPEEGGMHAAYLRADERQRQLQLAEERYRENTVLLQRWDRCMSKLFAQYDLITPEQRRTCDPYMPK